MLYAIIDILLTFYIFIACYYFIRYVQKKLVISTNKEKLEKETREYTLVLLYFLLYNCVEGNVKNERTVNVS